VQIAELFLKHAARLILKLVHSGAMPSSRPSLALIVAR
jgi:hypothetical protein